MTDPIASPSPRNRRGRSPDRLRQLARTLLRGERPYMLYIAFAVMLVVFSLASPWFLSVDNFLNIGRQTTLVSIVAVGMTFVIIARQIDLSVGSTLALSGMAAALAMSHVYNSWIVGAFAGLGTGAVVGLLNGLAHDAPGDPLIPGDARHAERCARARLDGHQHQAGDRHRRDVFLLIFGEGYFLGMPAPIAWTLAATIVGILLLTTTSSADGSTRPAAIRPRRSTPASRSGA